MTFHNVPIFYGTISAPLPNHHAEGPPLDAHPKYIFSSSRHKTDW